jgi:predicted  nucleic acid-binding Zn-ribbon protein
MKGVLGYAEGIFSVCDEENKNHRIYESMLWEHALASERILEMIEGRLLLGEPDHPETRTQSIIREGSHTVVEARKDGKYIRGTVAVFDNPLGRIVWPMLEAQVKLGFSTRGDGDLIEERGGRTRVDPKTYEWHGVDFVLNPSFVEARPTAITEETRKRVRLALTEAVESKKLGEDQKQLTEDVEALLAEPKPVDEGAGEDVVAPNPTKGLETALAQLEEAHTNLAERDQQIADLQRQLNELQSMLESMKKEHTQLEQQLGGARKKAAVAEAARKRDVEEMKSYKDKFKSLMVESQARQEQFAGTHRDLQKKHAEISTKYKRSFVIVEALRGQLKTAQEKLAEAEARATSAEKQLQESQSEVPQTVRAETLKQYKRLRTEGIEVPERLQPLLESAQNEADIDTVIDIVRDEKASRYPGLPYFGEYSRKQREALANRVTENTQESESSEDEYDQDSEDVRQVARKTISR